MNLVRGLATDEIHFASLKSISIGLPGPNSATWDSGLPNAVRDEPFHMVSARIKELFGQDFGVPVSVDHHLRLAALAEASVGRETPLQNVIYLRLSAGIGGAIVCSGGVARGAHQQAGEMGHVTVDHSASAIHCRCDRYGCLETVASLDALARSWAGGRDGQSERANFQAAALAGDEWAVELLQEAARQVGTALAMPVLVTDPAEVVLAGEVPTLLPDFLERVQAALWPGVLPSQHIPVRHAQLGDEAGALGGVVSLMTAHRDPQPLKEYPMTHVTSQNGAVHG